MTHAPVFLKKTGLHRLFEIPQHQENCPKLGAMLLSHKNQERFRLPKPMLLFLLINVTLTILSLLGFCYKYFYLKQHIRAYPHWPYWYYWPIGRNPHFPDIVCFVQRFRYLHTPAFFTTNPRLIGRDSPFEYPAASSFPICLLLCFSTLHEGLSRLYRALPHSARRALRKSHAEVRVLSRRYRCLSCSLPDLFLSLSGSNSRSPT